MNVELEAIRDIVETHTQVDISKKSRLRDIVHARYLYFTLCRENTMASFKKIADSLGGFNHATVLHGVKCFKETIIAYDKHYKQLYETIRVPKFSRKMLTMTSPVGREHKHLTPGRYYKYKFAHLLVNHRDLIFTYRSVVDELNKLKKLNKEHEDIIHNLRSENSRLAMVSEPQNI